MRTLMYSIAMLTILLTGGFILVITAWLIWPYEPIVMKPGNGTIENTVVKSGGYLSFRQVYCKNMNVPTTVNRQFVDGILYQAPQITANRPVGCYDRPELVYIPKALAAGTYYILDTVSVKVNPIRTITITVKTDKFTIVK